jgi:hypothetical protein
MEALRQNIRFVEKTAQGQQIALRRHPPSTCSAED